MEPTHDVARDRLDRDLAATRLRLAQLERERAELEERSAREDANRHLGVIR